MGLLQLRMSKEFNLCMFFRTCKAPSLPSCKVNPKALQWAELGVPEEQQKAYKRASHREQGQGCIWTKSLGHWYHFGFYSVYKGKLFSPHNKVGT